MANRKKQNTVKLFVPDSRSWGWFVWCLHKRFIVKIALKWDFTDMGFLCFLVNFFYFLWFFFVCVWKKNESKPHWTYLLESKNNKQQKPNIYALYGKTTLDLYFSFFYIFFWKEPINVFLFVFWLNDNNLSS